MLLFSCLTANAAVTYETWYCPSWPCPTTNQPILSTGTLTTGIMNYDWSGGYVLDSGRYDYVVVHLTGTFVMPGTLGQAYTVSFLNQDDDGSRLNIGGTTVIEDWSGLHGPANRTGSITLIGGQTYTYERWFSEWGGGAVLRQLWLITGIHGGWTWMDVGTDFTSPQAAPVLCCGGSSSSFNANPANTAKVITFTGRAGNDSQVYIDQIGNSNDVTVDQSGTKNNYTEYNASGSFNDVTITQSSTSTTATNYTELNINGNSNLINLTQSSTGGSKGIFATVNDDNNVVNITQSGAGNHYLNLGISGDNKTVGITQTGNAAHMADITLGGIGARSLDLTQQGSTQQFYSINSTCVSSCQAITVTQGQ